MSESLGRPDAGLPLGVVFFDVDGTLVPSTSSAQYLARWLGHLDDLVSAEAGYDAGELSNHEVCVRDALGWRDHTVAQVEAWLCGLPLVRGIAETVDWCRAHRLQPHLATLAWQPVGLHLVERFGFAGCCGPRLAVVDGRYTGDVEGGFDEYDKLAWAAAVAADAGIALAACAAVGDSRSDLPLLANVGLPIAFNASPAVRAAAAHVVDGDDLTAILPHLTAWLDGSSQRPAP
jgi:phosphoserine phosphatase